MVMIGFVLGVSFGLILSLMLDDIAKLWKLAIRREAYAAVLAAQAAHMKEGSSDEK